MTTLKTIKILGYKYKIDYEELEDMGRMNPIKQLITINSTLCDEQRSSTLLHEVIEAINYHLELKLPHKTIMGLESGLIQVLRDNKVTFNGI